MANLLRLGAWVAHDLLDGRETMVCPLPLCYIFALTAGLLFLKIGAHIILVTNPRELHGFIRAWWPIR